MTLGEIARIRTAFKQGKANDADFEKMLDEAVKFHHKVSDLQETLILIKKKCQMEMKELEDGKAASSAHMAMVLEFIIDEIEDSQHIIAA